MPPDPSLEVRFRHQLGTLTLNVDFTTTAPWSVLFGASGSGKSTILRAVAGLFRPDEGRIVIAGQVVFDSEAHIWVPAHQRPMRWAAQRVMLYPRRKLRQQWSMGMDLRDSQFSGRRWVAETEQAIDHFEVHALAGLSPNQLSGGQRQLAGVIRAAAGLNGRHLLLDEPFTGLDATIRTRLIENLRDWIGNNSVLSVTHDVEEAFLLNAEVIRIVEGRVTAQGSAAEILAEERIRILKSLAGT